MTEEQIRQWRRKALYYAGKIRDLNLLGMDEEDAAGEFLAELCRSGLVHDDPTPALLNTVLLRSLWRVQDRRSRVYKRENAGLLVEKSTWPVPSVLPELDVEQLTGWSAALPTQIVERNVRGEDFWTTRPVQALGSGAGGGPGTSTIELTNTETMRHWAGILAVAELTDSRKRVMAYLFYKLRDRMTPQDLAWLILQNVDSVGESVLRQADSAAGGSTSRQGTFRRWVVRQKYRARSRARDIMKAEGVSSLEDAVRKDIQAVELSSFGTIPITPETRARLVAVGVDVPFGLSEAGGRSLLVVAGESLEGRPGCYQREYDPEQELCQGCLVMPSCWRACASYLEKARMGLADAPEGVTAAELAEVIEVFGQLPTVPDPPFTPRSELPSIPPVPPVPAFDSEARIDLPLA